MYGKDRLWGRGVSVVIVELSLKCARYFNKLKMNRRNAAAACLVSIPLMIIFHITIQTISIGVGRQEGGICLLIGERRHLCNPIRRKGGRRIGR